jgi:hypothetical protein
MMGAPKSIGAVTCPHCQAGPGAPCIGDGEGYHVARFSAALGPQGANPAPAEPEKVTDPHACGVPADAVPLWVAFADPLAPCPSRWCDHGEDPGPEFVDLPDSRGVECPTCGAAAVAPPLGFRDAVAEYLAGWAIDPTGAGRMADHIARLANRPAPEPLPFSATDVALLLDVADAIVMRVEGWPMTAGALRDLADRLDAAL